LINKGFLNTNTVITRQLIRTARMLEAEWRQVLQGSMGTGAKEDESSTGYVWAYGFHHIMACSHSARVLKLMNCLFLNFNFFGGSFWISGHRGTPVFPYPNGIFNPIQIHRMKINDMIYKTILIQPPCCHTQYCSWFNTWCSQCMNYYPIHAKKSYLKGLCEISGFHSSVAVGSSLLRHFATLNGKYWII
jgi:hypothetical protein